MSSVNDPLHIRGVMQPWADVLGAQKVVQPAVDVLGSVRVVQPAVDVLGSVRVMQPWADVLGAQKVVQPAVDVLGSVRVMQPMLDAVNARTLGIDELRQFAVRPMIDALDAGAVLEELAGELSESQLEEFSLEQVEVAEDAEAEKHYRRRLRQAIATNAAVSQYSAQAMDGIENLGVLVAWTIVQGLIASLIVMLGGPAFLIAVVLTGTGLYVEQSIRDGWSPRKQVALARDCAFCGAVPGAKCVVTRGGNIGRPAQRLHAERYVEKPDVSHPTTD